ncbi:MAG: hypothetical protein Q9168_007921 [Polycauliona sp. 1 TL-2023]
MSIEQVALQTVLIILKWVIYATVLSLVVTVGGWFRVWFIKPRLLAAPEAPAPQAPAPQAPAPQAPPTSIQPRSLGPPLEGSNVLNARAAARTPFQLRMDRVMRRAPATEHDALARGGPVPKPLGLEERVRQAGNWMDEFDPRVRRRQIQLGE